MFSTTILGNVDERRTECEISDGTQTTVAVVYENRDDGWQVDLCRSLTPAEEGEFNAAVETAKRSLVHYVNRFGDGAPADATVGALSLWLMMKDDGSAMGIDLQTLQPRTVPDDPEAQTRIHDLSAAVSNRIRQIASDGREIEAIRELRIATGCSLKQAKEWLARR
jgi:hypothetical protein